MVYAKRYSEKKLINNIGQSVEIKVKGNFWLTWTIKKAGFDYKEDIFYIDEIKFEPAN